MVVPPAYALTCWTVVGSPFSYKVTLGAEAEGTTSSPFHLLPEILLCQKFSITLSVKL